ncbi:MAG: pseudouridine synthase [Candidatus Vogelbacteria bacterium]|nr:pseudouridine synthase [Candidatus Vogelbacteria bacterium]
MTDEDLKFPMRINKYMAHKGFSTRTGADALIEKGRVTINGRVAKLGEKILETDVIEVASKNNKNKKNNESEAEPELIYLAYNKPKGEETPIRNSLANSNGASRPMLAGERPRVSLDVFPVGRLDKDSSGLLILTNDGRITDRLLNPKNVHDKEYEVEVDKKVTDFFLRTMEHGVDIEGYKTKPCQTRKIDDHKFRITLTEGKKHQIRRMCVALGFQVKELKRVRILNICLDNLPVRNTRFIDGKTREEFLVKLGLIV